MRTAITLRAPNHSDIMRRYLEKKCIQYEECVSESTDLRKVLLDLQGSAGPRGPEGPSGKPGDDVSKTFT